MDEEHMENRESRIGVLQRELDGIKAEIKARTKGNKRCNIETGKEDR